MSAWYVFSALGFYPVLPGSTQYVLGSPLFDRATIRLDNGRQFIVSASGGGGPYIARASFNGSEDDRGYLEHADIIGGGELRLVRAERPVTSRASAENVRPRSSIDDPSVVAAPFVADGRRLYRDVQRVRLGTADTGAEIRFTTDGSVPTRSSTRYTQPVTIQQSLTLKAAAFRGKAASPVITLTFRRLTDFPKITLSAPYAPQYAAAGDDTLIDGLRGNESFKTGRWQGYRGRDLAVTLDLGERRAVRQVSMGFLQDSGSWIFMPRRIIVEGSGDGTQFAQLGAVENSVPEREAKPVTHDFTLDLDQPASIRYLRIRVVPYGLLPQWHPGAGEPAWYFADEVVVR
jgi:hypothetical protein